MSKIKWLVLECNLTHKKLTQKLLDNPFDVETGYGFRVAAKFEDQIVSTFIERTTTTESIVDPFGASTEIEMIRYVLIKFRLHLTSQSDRFLLEISNPPRSIRTLVTNLREALGSIAIEEFTLPVLEIYSKIKKDSLRARIIRLKANGIPISETSLIQVEVTSSKDALADFRNYFGKSSTVIEKIRIEHPFIDGRGFLEIGANGFCSFDESAEEHVRAIVIGLSRA